MKLMQRAISTITRPGKVTSHQNLRPSLWPSSMRTPSAGVRRLDAEAEERESRLGEDRGGDDQRRVDDDRPDRVREHVADDDPRVAGTGRLRRLDELLLSQRQERAADDAGEARPEEEREDDGDAERVPLARRTRRCVSSTARPGRVSTRSVSRISAVVDPAAEVAADGADRRADHRREQGDDERHPERRPQPVDDAAEGVAAEEVGAEVVMALRRGRDRDADEVGLVEWRTARRSRRRSRRCRGRAARRGSPIARRCRRKRRSA